MSPICSPASHALDGSLKQLQAQVRVLNISVSCKDTDTAQVVIVFPDHRRSSVDFDPEVVADRTG